MWSSLSDLIKDSIWARMQGDTNLKLPIEGSHVLISKWKYDLYKMFTNLLPNFKNMHNLCIIPYPLRLHLYKVDGSWRNIMYELGMSNFLPLVSVFSTSNLSDMRTDKRI